jgi:hypothetical protein
VLRVEPVAKRVADNLIGHHPGMPGVGQAKQTVSSARSVVHRLHVLKMARPHAPHYWGCRQHSVHIRMDSNTGPAGIDL